MSIYPQFDPDAYLEKIRREAASIESLATKQNPEAPEKDANDAGDATPKPEPARITALESDPVERAAICEFDGGIPREWAEGFAKLQGVTPPASVTEQRWLQVIDDAGRFLDSWGAKLAALGWQVGETFGVHPARPELRRGGLIWHLRGRRVLAASKDSVTVETSSGKHSQIYRRTDDECVFVWEIANDDA